MTINNNTYTTETSIPAVIKIQRTIEIPDIDSALNNLRKDTAVIAKTHEIYTKAIQSASSSMIEQLNEYFKILLAPLMKPENKEVAKYISSQQVVIPLTDSLGFVNDSVYYRINEGCYRNSTGQRIKGMNVIISYGHSSIEFYKCCITPDGNVYMDNDKISSELLSDIAITWPKAKKELIQSFEISMKSFYSSQKKKARIAEREYMDIVNFHI